MYIVLCTRYDVQGTSYKYVPSSLDVQCAHVHTGIYMHPYQQGPLRGPADSTTKVVEMMCVHEYVCAHRKSYSYAPEGVAGAPTGAWCDAVTRGHVYTTVCTARATAMHLWVWLVLLQG